MGLWSICRGVWEGAKEGHIPRAQFSPVGKDRRECRPHFFRTELEKTVTRSARKRIQQALRQPWLQCGCVVRLAQNEMAVRSQNWCEGERAHERVCASSKSSHRGPVILLRYWRGLLTITTGVTLNAVVTCSAENPAKNFAGGGASSLHSAVAGEFQFLAIWIIRASDSEHKGHQYAAVIPNGSNPQLSSQEKRPVRRHPQCDVPEFHRQASWVKSGQGAWVPDTLDSAPMAKGPIPHP